MKKTNQITTTNIINNTNNTNTTTNKGVNNMKKTRKFRTRLIAGILSTITVFSVGTMAIGSEHSENYVHFEIRLANNNGIDPTKFIFER